MSIATKNMYKTDFTYFCHDETKKIPNVSCINITGRETRIDKESIFRPSKLLLICHSLFTNVGRKCYSFEVT